MQPNTTEEPRASYDVNASLTTKNSGKIPLITLKQAAEWANTGTPYPESWPRTISIASKVGPRAYAVDVLDNQMWTICPAGSRVVIDPDMPVKTLEYGAYLDPATGSTVIAQYLFGFGQERLAFSDAGNYIPINGPIVCLGQVTIVLPRILTATPQATAKPQTIAAPQPSGVRTSIALSVDQENTQGRSGSKG